MTRLQVVRAAMMMTTGDLEVASGVAKSTICRAESRRHAPNLETRIRLARVLGLDPDRLMDDVPAVGQDVVQLLALGPVTASDVQRIAEATGLSVFTIRGAK